MAVTIKQIAEIAGVHRSTVDKVLHHRKGVSEEVRKRIQRIIEEYNYEVNPIGKALKMQDKVIHIRVILLDVDALSFIKKGIELEHEQYQSFQIELSYIITSHSDVMGQQKALFQCVDDNVDGVIISPINTWEIILGIDRCMESEIPVITLNTDIKGSKRMVFIGQDGYKAGRIAGRLMGEFLRGQGKVALLTSDGDNYQSFAFGTREEGFREVIAESFPEIEVMHSIVVGESADTIKRELSNICDNKVDLSGLFITCGGVAGIRSVLMKYRDRGIKVICYENYPEILSLMEEEIVTATLDSKIIGQGKKAMAVLFDFLLYNKYPERRHLYTETNIILKESL